VFGGVIPREGETDEHGVDATKEAVEPQDHVVRSVVDHSDE
jgi:hypothetical protein